jgi:hypothetical protein
MRSVCLCFSAAAAPSFLGRPPTAHVSGNTYSEVHWLRTSRNVMELFPIARPTSAHVPVHARRASGESGIPQPPSPHTVIVTRSCSSMAGGVCVGWLVGGSEALPSRETCDGLGGSLLAVRRARLVSCGLGWSVWLVWCGRCWSRVVSGRVVSCRVVSYCLGPGASYGIVPSRQRSVAR